MKSWRGSDFRSTAVLMRIRDVLSGSLLKDKLQPQWAL
jgi:hypothetical protein